MESCSLVYFVHRNRVLIIPLCSREVKRRARAFFQRLAYSLLLRLPDANYTIVAAAGDSPIKICMIGYATGPL